MPKRWGFMFMTHKEEMQPQNLNLKSFGEDQKYNINLRKKWVFSLLEVCTWLFWAEWSGNLPYASKQVEGDFVYGQFEPCARFWSWVKLGWPKPIGLGAPLSIGFTWPIRKISSRYEEDLTKFPINLTKIYSMT